MQVLKNGALLSVPNLLNSRSLVVRVVGAGLISHLLNLFDYNWGANHGVFRALIGLIHQGEEFAAVIGAAAIFELVHRGTTTIIIYVLKFKIKNLDKIDMLKLTNLKVIQRILDLIETCNYPGFRRAFHKFLLK